MKTSPISIPLSNESLIRHRLLIRPHGQVELFTLNFELNSIGRLVKGRDLYGMNNRNLSEIQEQFNKVSKQYDSQRRLLIPCFDDFYSISLPLISGLKNARRLLDIGAGTGLFSQFVYQERPDLHFTLADISTEMLAVARERFKDQEQVDFMPCDFAAGEIKGTYDIIISALAIHHLEDAAKEKLYRSVFKALNPGGLFINADQVAGRTSRFDSYYKTHWAETVKDSGLEQPAIDGAMERIKLDQFAKLETQLQMLEKAGFTDVDCMYQHHNFVVFGGFKSEQQ